MTPSSSPVSALPGITPEAVAELQRIKLPTIDDLYDVATEPDWPASPLAQIAPGVRDKIVECFYAWVNEPYTDEDMAELLEANAEAAALDAAEGVAE